MASQREGSEAPGRRLRTAGIAGGVVVVAAIVVRIALTAAGRGSTSSAGVLDVAIFAGAGAGSVLSILRAPAPRRFIGLVAAACLLALAAGALVPLLRHR